MNKYMLQIILILVLCGCGVGISYPFPRTQEVNNGLIALGGVWSFKQPDGHDGQLLIYHLSATNEFLAVFPDASTAILRVLLVDGHSFVTIIIGELKTLLDVDKTKRTHPAYLMVVKEEQNKLLFYSLNPKLFAEDFGFHPSEDESGLFGAKTYSHSNTDLVSALRKIINESELLDTVLFELEKR